MKENKSTLTEEQIEREVVSLEGWFRDGKFLKKEFIFANYKEINVFLPYMAATVVTHNHHPDFAFDSGNKRMSMQMTTHSAGGLTQADLNLATALNQWRVKMA